MTLNNSVEKTDDLDRNDHLVLSILEQIEKDPKTSQRSLASQLGVALGLVNSLIKRAATKGYVKVKRINSRNIQYLLTPRGIYEKSRLTYRFIRHSFQYLATYRQNTYEVLSPYADQGINEVVILGSGDEAELSYLVILELGMELTAIVDPNKQGERCIGYDIQDLSWLLEQEKVDLLLVLHAAGISENFAIQKQQIRQQGNVSHLLSLGI